jgi:hypothetical protein
MIFVSIGITSFIFGSYYQSQLYKHISPDKHFEVDKVFNIPFRTIPSREILDEEGVKYHNKFIACIIAFAISILLSMLIPKYFSS